MLAVIMALVASSCLILILPSILIHDHFKLLIITAINTILCLLFIFLFRQRSQTIQHSKLKLRFLTASFILLINLLVVIIVSTVYSPHIAYILSADPLALLAYWHYAQVQIGVETSSDKQLQVQIEGVFPRKFDIKEIIDATKNVENKSSAKEYFDGTVLRGKLADGRRVLIKYQRSNSTRDAFLAEITAVAQIKHDNLIQFLGYCIAPDFSYLVYEQVDSLRSWIFSDDSNIRKLLTVDLRYHVALDVAKALTYIHTHRKIFRSFVKPSIIFLTRELKAKVGFSLSETLLTDVSSYYFRNNMATEFLRSHESSDKSDVYIYGALLLELASGHRDFNFGAMDVNEVIKSMYITLTGGKLMEGVELSLEMNEGDEDKLEVMVKVGLLCVQEKPEMRPSMSEVIAMLLGRHPLPSAEQIPSVLTM